MNKAIFLRRRIILAWLAALGTALLLMIGCDRHIPPLTEEEKRQMSSISHSMTTRCLGRYLIDLPQDFELYPPSWHSSTIDGVKLAIEPMEQAAFQKSLQARTAELANAKMWRKPHFPMLHQTFSIDGKDGMGMVFDRAESDAGYRLSRTLELRGWKSGYAIHAAVNATSHDFPEFSHDQSMKKRLEIDVPEKLQQLLSLYRRIHGRADTEVPTKPGLCIPYGFVEGPGSKGEAIDFGYVMKGTPDVSMNFHQLTNVGSDTTLLERYDQIDAMLARDSGFTIRKGHVKGQVPTAQEWLMCYKKPNEVMRQYFTLEANSKAPSVSMPLIVLDVNTGLRYRTSLNDTSDPLPMEKTTFNESQAIALWDAIVATLRPRPGAL
jgi:hypothetical protein